jgi:peptidoglycan LD-endopeptidase LytH
MLASYTTPFGRGLTIVTLGFVGVAVLARTFEVDRGPGARLAVVEPSPSHLLRLERIAPVRTVFYDEDSAITSEIEAEDERIPPVSAPPPSYLLLMPVKGVSPDQIRDSFTEFRDDGERFHAAIDIMAPTGTPVLAAVDGEILRLQTGGNGGRAIYQLGPDERYVFYYAHLDAFADSLVTGQWIRRGEVIGYVGYTGNASPSAPHLHFAVWRQRPGGTGWGGAPVNPYLLLRRAGWRPLEAVAGP